MGVHVEDEARIPVTVPRNWYRNGDSSIYHLESDTWVDSGFAVCGVLIPSPGFVLPVGGEPISGRRKCSKCKSAQKRHYGK